jgi:ribosome-binding factor A
MEESKRQKQFSRLLQKDLGEIFQQNASRFFDGAFITVTQVKITPDLKIAKVYLSFLATKQQDMIMELVQEQTKSVRQQLAQRIKNQVRVIPELLFFKDDTQEVAAKIDKLFEDLHIPPEDENNDMSDYKE